MKNMKYSILVVSLIAGGMLANTEKVTVKKGRLSRACEKTRVKLSNHKGKVGLATGVIGTTVLTRVFSDEINEYVKPLLKNVFKRVGRFFKRVFKRDKKKVSSSG